MQKQNIPQLRFPEFNGEWEEKKLKDVAKITTGSTPSTVIKEHYGGSILFVSPADINNQRYIKDTKTKLTDLGFKKTRNIPKGSVLFVSIGSTIGKVGQAFEVCATNQQINALTANSLFSNDFIFSLLNANGANIKLLAGTQAVPLLNKSDFSNLCFYFPTLPEQQQIASFLSTVDKKIQQLHQKEQLLQQYKKGMMQKLFSRQLRFKDDNGNNYPEWKEKKLGEVAKITTGNTPSTTVSKYYGGNKLFISPADINKERFINTTKTKLSDLGFEKTRNIPKESVLFVSIGSTIGKVGQAASLCATNQQINALTAYPLFSNSFIYSLLEYNGKKIKLLAGTQAVPQLNKTDFSNLKFDFPSIEEQTRIANFLTAIDDKINAVNNEVAQASAFKKGLLQQMFV